MVLPDPDVWCSRLFRAVGLAAGLSTVGCAAQVQPLDAGPDVQDGLRDPAYRPWCPEVPPVMGAPCWPGVRCEYNWQGRVLTCGCVTLEDSGFVPGARCTTTARL